MSELPASAFPVGSEVRLLGDPVLWEVADVERRTLRYVHLQQKVPNGIRHRRIRADILIHHQAAAARHDQEGQPISIQEAFGARLRELRVDRGFTQSELSRLARIHWSYLSSAERGQRNVTLAIIDDLAAALGVTICDFFESVT